MHSRSKKKSTIIKNHCRQTGGGGPCEVLNEIEERIAQSISKTAISGLEMEESQTLEIDFPEWDLASEAAPTAVPEIEQPQGTVEGVSVNIKVKHNLKKRKNKKNTEKISMEKLCKQKILIKKKYYAMKIKLLNKQVNAIQQISNNLAELKSYLCNKN
jgi:hypothetical protein